MKIWFQMHHISLFPLPKLHTEICRYNWPWSWYRPHTNFYQSVISRFDILRLKIETIWLSICLKRWQIHRSRRIFNNVTYWTSWKYWLAWQVSALQRDRNWKKDNCKICKKINRWKKAITASKLQTVANAQEDFSLKWLHTERIQR